MWERLKDWFKGNPLPPAENVAIWYNERHFNIAPLHAMRWYDKVFLCSEWQRLRAGMPMKNTKNEALVLRLFGHPGGKYDSKRDERIKASTRASV